jgi:hypothetical protein
VQRERAKYLRLTEKTDIDGKQRNVKLEWDVLAKQIERFFQENSGIPKSKSVI